MASCKKIPYAMNKKWYPPSKLAGSPVSTEQVAEHALTDVDIEWIDIDFRGGGAGAIPGRSSAQCASGSARGSSSG